MNRRLRGRWTIAIAAIVLVGVALAAVRWRGSARPAPPAGEGVAAAGEGVAHAQRPPGVALPAAALEQNAIGIVKVTRARLAGDLSVVGSVAVDQNQYAIVGPLVSGRVTKLVAPVGKTVRVGELLAEIDSPEVGQARAAWLSATARFRAADANAKRERELASERVSSAREREVAEAQAVSEAAELRAAVERLRAFGVRATVDGDDGDAAMAGGRVALRAPIAGTVVARHITLGQAVERATDAFKIVNLERLWVLLDIYEKDLGRVHVGQKVELRTEALPGRVLPARVAYVSPIVDDKTRTANVRIELDNKHGELRPGQFVTARLVGDTEAVAREVLAVPRRAVQTVDGKPIVFVKDGARFHKRPVELGASAGDLVEVKSGLADGDPVAAEGAFLLKSELLR